MKKWEYSFLSTRKQPAEIGDKLRQAGIEGWDLVSVYPMHVSANSKDTNANTIQTIHYFWFKRQLGV